MLIYSNRGMSCIYSYYRKSIFDNILLGKKKVITVKSSSD